MSKKLKLGIIQSRGLGDIIISLPIAHYYYTKENYEIFWPICKEFYPSVTNTASWINWIPIQTDNGLFFYDTPFRLLKQKGCDEILALYQALTGHPEFTQEPYFQFTKFDQYKYFKAQVPFHYKWQLNQCITRDLKREQDLYNKLVTNPNYAVLHLEGSDHKTNFDRSLIPEDWQIIEISNITDNIFDWLTILEKAQSLIMIDSVFANLIDQLGIGDDRYFIPRSHIQLTPTLGHHWTWLENPNLNPHNKIFRAS